MGGRTSRRRQRKKKSFSVESDIIPLRKWMRSHNWNNSTFKLYTFTTTGRGLLSLKSFQENEILLEVPFKCMITAVTAEAFMKEKLFRSAKLKIHDLLSCFLAFHLSDSNWAPYISSLDNIEIFKILPWLTSDEEHRYLPEDLQEAVSKNKNNFVLSWERVKKSIAPKYQSHLNEMQFARAYGIVNTRAVYVDPNMLKKSCWFDVLVDEPSMALCPFLDMFNHSNKVLSKAVLTKCKREGLVFKLYTLTKFNKFEQVFISYGSRNNVSLLCDYGFFITDDQLETVSVNLSEVIDILRCSLNRKQNEYIFQKGFNTGLYIYYNSVSFNLKALIFIILRPDTDWCKYIFSDNYDSKYLIDMHHILKEMVKYKINDVGYRLPKIDSDSIYLNYLKYRLTFMKRLLQTIGEQIFL